MKTIADINKKLKQGGAVVLTAREFKDAVRSGKGISPKKVDVVTTATFGVMSGTAAVLSIPIGKRGRFKRAKEIYINDVPAFPGPCPNESLGIVEAVLYGTTPSKKDPKRYGGGHVFFDLTAGKKVKVEVKTVEGNRIQKLVSLKELDFARMVTTRSCFKNYSAVINSKSKKVDTIFSVTGLKGPFLEATVSGCGEINPLENDPDLKTIGVGTRVLLNGAVGYVAGKGTRSSKDRPNLSLFADMKKMKPEFMGGFITALEPDSMVSVAIPIPVIDEEVFENLKILDEQIALPVVDIHGRVPIGNADYGEVWQGRGKKIKFNKKVCASCSSRRKCRVEKICPSASFERTKGIDLKRCFYCGACVSACQENALQCDLGTINVKGREIPITLNQSCRVKAERIARELKRLIYKGGFTLNDKAADITFSAGKKQQK